MEKFTKIRPNKEKKMGSDIIHDGEFLKVIKFEDWEIIGGKDSVMCIPYLIELNQFIIRKEYIPSFKYIDGSEYHLSTVGGGIEIGETPEVALIREIQEEAGLVLRDDYKIQFDKPLFLGKCSSIKVFTAIVPLTENDYHEVIIKGDGSKIEKMSQTVKMDVKYLNSLNSSDVVTELLLKKFKEYLNI